MKELLWKGTVAHNNYSGTNSKILWETPLSYSYSVELHRSCHRRCSKKIVLKIFAKFTGIHLSQSLFLKKVAGLRPAISLKIENLAQVCTYEFCKAFKNTYFEEHLWTNLNRLRRQIWSCGIWRLKFSTYWVILTMTKIGYNIRNSKFDLRLRNFRDVYLGNKQLSGSNKLTV